MSIGYESKEHIAVDVGHSSPQYKAMPPQLSSDLPDQLTNEPPANVVHRTHRLFTEVETPSNAGYEWQSLHGAKQRNDLLYDGNSQNPLLQRTVFGHNASRRSSTSSTGSIPSEHSNSSSSGNSPNLNTSSLQTKQSILPPPHMTPPLVPRTRVGGKGHSRRTSAELLRDLSVSDDRQPPSQSVLTPRRRAAHQRLQQFTQHSDDGVSFADSNKSHIVEDEAARRVKALRIRMHDEHHEEKQPHSSSGSTSDDDESTEHTPLNAAHNASDASKPANSQFTRPPVARKMTMTGPFGLGHSRTTSLAANALSSPMHSFGVQIGGNMTGITTALNSQLPPDLQHSVETVLLSPNSTANRQNGQKHHNRFKSNLIDLEMSPMQRSSVLPATVNEQHPAADYIHPSLYSTTPPLRRLPSNPVSARHQHTPSSIFGHSQPLPETLTATDTPSFHSRRTTVNRASTATSNADLGAYPQPSTSFKPVAFLTRANDMQELTLNDISNYSHMNRQRHIALADSKLPPVAEIVNPFNTEETREFLKTLGASLFSVALPMHVVEFYIVLGAHRLGEDVHLMSVWASMWMRFGEESECHLIQPAGVSYSLSKMVELCHVTERILTGTTAVKEGLAQIQNIITRPSLWPVWNVMPAMCFMSCASAVLWNGRTADMLTAGFTGLCIGTLDFITPNHIMLARGHDLLSGLVAALIMVLVNAYIHEVYVIPSVFGGILWCLPGLRATLAMNDLSTGNPVTGTAKLMSAIITCIQLGIGVQAGLSLNGLLGGGKTLITSAPTSQPMWMSEVAVIIDGYVTMVLFDAKPAHWHLLIGGSVVAFTLSSYSALYIGNEFGTWLAAFVTGVIGNLYGE